MCVAAIAFSIQLSPSLRLRCGTISRRVNLCMLCVSLLWSSCMDRRHHAAPELYQSAPPCCSRVVSICAAMLGLGGAGRSGDGSRYGNLFYVRIQPSLGWRGAGLWRPGGLVTGPGQHCVRYGWSANVRTVNISGGTARNFVRKIRANLKRTKIWGETFLPLLVGKD
jgi:hypothetical protein